MVDAMGLALRTGGLHPNVRHRELSLCAKICRISTMQSTLLMGVSGTAVGLRCWSFLQHRWQMTPVCIEIPFLRLCTCKISRCAAALCDASEEVANLKLLVKVPLAQRNTRMLFSLPKTGP